MDERLLSCRIATIASFEAESEDGVYEAARRRPRARFDPRAATALGRHLKILLAVLAAERVRLVVGGIIS
jgi:hypothetical protein